MSFWKDLIDKILGEEDASEMYDIELITDKTNRLYIKTMALNTVADFVGRTFSTARFRVMNGSDHDEEWEYILNVRPNKNQSSSMFWHKAISKLIQENELLIIQTQEGDLLVADEFFKEQYAVYDYRFKNVISDGLPFKRTFEMSEVIYLQYNSEKLDKFLNELSIDYAELYSRYIEIAKRNNQIRGTIDLKNQANFGEKERKQMEAYVKQLTKVTKEESVAIMPIADGMEYTEFGNTVGNKVMESPEVLSMTDKLIDHVAQAVGVPPSLVKGEYQDLEKNAETYRKNTLNPLVKRIEDELNAKLVTKREYKNGKRIEIDRVYARDMLDAAADIEKLIGSGAQSINDILVKFGEERIDDPLYDQHYITKNFAELEGGDSDNDETKD